MTSIADSTYKYGRGLTNASFQANAPTMGNIVFGNVGIGFSVCFLSRSSGFTTPEWLGYPSAKRDNRTPGSRIIRNKSLQAGMTIAFKASPKARTTIHSSIPLKVLFRLFSIVAPLICFAMGNQVLDSFAFPESMNAMLRAKPSSLGCPLRL